MKIMTKDEIRCLCAQNETIAKAYAEFVKTHPYAKIVEMESMAHYFANVDEAYITYLVGGWRKVTYRYYKEN